MTLSRNCHITEIIDIDALGELFQQLSNATGICTAVLDLDGKILIATYWQDICVNFHRVADGVRFDFLSFPGGEKRGNAQAFEHCLFAKG